MMQPKMSQLVTRVKPECYTSGHVKSTAIPLRLQKGSESQQWLGFLDRFREARLDPVCAHSAVSFGAFAHESKTTALVQL